MSTDRREFLKFLFGGTVAGAVMSPLEILIQSAIGQVHNESMAESQLNKFYFNIAFPGAPDRATYDLFLDPYGADGQNFITSRGVANCFGSSVGSQVYDEAIYKTYRVAKHNIYAPWMWGQKMPTSNGFKNIFELMDNMILFQGIHSASPGHGLSQVRSEEANNLTLSGLLADATSTPLNALTMNSPYTFKSAKGSFVTPLVDSISVNMIANLMAQFDRSRITTFSNLKNSLASAFKNAVDNLNYEAATRNPSSINLKKTYEGALDIITSSTQNLETVWNTKLTKYRSLTQLAATDRTNFVGFLDKAIGTPTRDNRYSVEIGGICLNPDVRDLVFNDSCSSMAGIFAMAEFIADNKYAAAMNVRISLFQGMLQKTGALTARRQTISHDQHNVGTMVRTLTNAVMYRSLSSCIYELRNFLKTESKGFKFNESVIRLSGEFGRSPRADGSGSDHGWQATTTTLYTGMVDKPIILGRIVKDGVAKGVHNAMYAGSWGVGAKINMYGIEDYITQGNVISSVATLLGIASPSINNPSLLTIRNSKAELIDNNHKLTVVT